MRILQSDFKKPDPATRKLSDELARILIGPMSQETFDALMVKYVPFGAQFYQQFAISARRLGVTMPPSNVPRSPHGTLSFWDETTKTVKHVPADD